MTEAGPVSDRIGATYSEAFADRPGQLAAGRWLMDRLADRDKPLVLDVGCGSGEPTARQLIDGGMRVVGVDTSPVMLELARHTVPEAIFVERDLFDLDGLHPTEQRFDGVVAFFSLLLLPRSDIEMALDDIRHVLAHDGVFALGMVEGDTDHLMCDYLGTPVPLTAYPREELRHLLNRHGFIVSELHAIPGHPTPTVPPTPQTHIYTYCTTARPD